MSKSKVEVGQVAGQWAPAYDFAAVGAAVFDTISDDPLMVAYRPRYNQLTGSVLGTIFLQQVAYLWVNLGKRKAFYMFNAPAPANKHYRAGYSWAELLGFGKYEIINGRAKVAMKVPPDEAAAALQIFPIVYYTDFRRLTFYDVNPALLGRMLAECQAGALDQVAPLFIGTAMPDGAVGKWLHEFRQQAGNKVAELAARYALAARASANGQG